MIISVLFKHWLSLWEALINPLLSEQASELLADQARSVILAMAKTPTTQMQGVLLKLEAYEREVEAGPCEECDLLLASALEDRSALGAEPPDWQALLASGGRDEQGRAQPRKTEAWDDPAYQYPVRQNEDHRSTTA